MNMRQLCSLTVLLVALAPLAQARTTTYAGETVVRNLDSNRVAVFIDSDGDHLIDNGFLLTTDIPMHGDISAHLSTASVTFSDGYVRVVGDDDVYDLQVAGYPDPPAAPDGRKVVTLIGSALQHSTGDSGCDVARAQEKASACFAYGAE